MSTADPRLRHIRHPILSTVSDIGGYLVFGVLAVICAVIFAAGIAAVLSVGFAALRYADVI